MKPPVGFNGVAVTVACTDTVRSERFYCQLLGAQPLAGNGYGCRWYRLGALTFSLCPNAAARSAGTFPVHAGFMLWLEVEDLEAARRHLVENDVTLVNMDEGQSMIVADPDGLLLEIWQAQGK